VRRGVRHGSGVQQHALLARETHSGYSLEDLSERSLTDGLGAFLKKPYTLDELRETVQALVEG
jgi:hypothetical protein